MELKSKSNNNSFVSSVPIRLPTAHTSLFLTILNRHTTPKKKQVLVEN
jgi:hypothetical protein